MNYSGYNHLQQQHSYNYDPSQIQHYDQSYSYQPYYPYNHQYAYFPSDTHQPHLQFQPEPTPVHPPGVNPTAPEPVPPRPNHALTAPAQNRGRGGRGGRPFRQGGRGRGRFNHEGPASYHGRGRGVGGGRHIASHSSGPAISNAPGAPTTAGATSVVQTSSSVSGQATLPKPAQVPTAPLQPPPKIYCEICKIECNSLEIMEQHKNGKRHKKNMKVHEELQRRSVINGQQSEQLSTPQLNLPDQPKNVQKSEKKECPTENLGSEITANNHKDKIELQNNVGETSEVSAEEPEGKTMENSAARGRGLKRKMRGGKVSKYMKTNDGSRPVQLSKPEQAISFKCELCNVKCESNVVYQSHLNGKKHLSRLKRGPGHQTSSIVGQQASSEVPGLQAPYPPDINALANAINAQVQQGDNDPQLLLAQLLMTVLSQAQVPAISPQSGPLAGQIPAPTSVAGSSYGPQLLQTQIAAHVEMENPAGEAKNELLSSPPELNGRAGSSVTQIEGGSAETKQVLQQPQDSSGMTPADNSGATNEQIPS